MEEIFEIFTTERFGLEREALKKIGWKNNELIALYSWLMANAAYKSHYETVDGVEIELHPGDVIVTRSKLAAVLGAPEGTCYKRLKRLETLGIVKCATEPGRRYSIVTIPSIKSALPKS